MSHSKKKPKDPNFPFTESPHEDKARVRFSDPTQETRAQEMEDFQSGQVSPDHYLFKEVDDQLDALAKEFTDALEIQLARFPNIFFFEAVDKKIKDCLDKFRRAPQKEIKKMAGIPHVEEMVYFRWAQNGRRLEVCWTEHPEEGKRGVQKSKPVPRHYWDFFMSPAKKKKLKLVERAKAIKEPEEEKEASFANRAEVRKGSRQNEERPLTEQPETFDIALPSFTDREKERQKRRQTKKKGLGLGEEG